MSTLLCSALLCRFGPLQQDHAVSYAGSSCPMTTASGFRREESTGRKAKAKAKAKAIPGLVFSANLSASHGALPIASRPRNKPLGCCLMSGERRKTLHPSPFTLHLQAVIRDTRCLHEPCQTVSSIIIRSDSLNLRPPFSMVANIDASARDDPLDCAEASARTNSIQHCTPTLPLTRIRACLNMMMMIIVLAPHVLLARLLSTSTK